MGRAHHLLQMRHRRVGRARELQPNRNMSTATQPSSEGARRLHGHVCQSVSGDLPDIAVLLRRCFEAGDDAAFASRPALQWKYIEPADAGLEDASYVLGAAGRIVAHAGLRTV